MKTIYLTRAFRPVAVNAPKPGDTYNDPVWGDCKRMTAKRFCLAAERAGKESEAFVGLLQAIAGASEDGAYDGRAVEDWYGLVGVALPEVPPPQLVRVICPRCFYVHYALEENGRVWNNGVCGPCWSKDFYEPRYA